MQMNCDALTLTVPDAFRACILTKLLQAKGFHPGGKHPCNGQCLGWADRAVDPPV